jgi:hypothetical protein
VLQLPQNFALVSKFAHCPRHCDSVARQEPGPPVLDDDDDDDPPAPSDLQYKPKVARLPEHTPPFCLATSVSQACL